MPTYDFAGTGALSSDWTMAIGTVARDSDHGESSGLGVAFWNGGSFADDQYSQCTVTLVSAGFTSSGPVVRASTTNGGTWYGARLCPSCGDVSIEERSSFSGPTGLASAGSVPTSGFPLTYTLRLEAEGTALRAYLNGVLTVSTTDGSITSGRPGVQTSSTTATYVDDWDGGDLASGTTISPSQASGAGTAQAPSIRTSPTISPSGVTCSCSAQAPSIRTSPKISPAQAAGTGAAQAPSIVMGAIISPAQGAGTGAAQAPSLKTTATIVPTFATGFGSAGAPTIQAVDGGGSTTVTPGTAYGYGTAGLPTLVGVDPPGILWRIGGYQCPASVSPSTGARALANR